MPSRDKRRQKELVRRSNAVRDRAMKELISRHLEEYREIYREKAAEIGVSPMAHVGAKRKTAEEAIEEVKKSGIIDGVVVPPPTRKMSAYPEPEILREQRMTRDEILSTRVEGSVPPPPWEV